MNTNLIHFSAEPLGSIESRVQERRAHGKPKGLWVSVEGDEDGWRDWCLGEQFGLERLAVAQHVRLADDAQILYVDSAAGIDDLGRRYGTESEYWTGPRPYYDRIDWAQVAECYQGIIIAPYIWSRRLDGGAFWYYGWDCASGCIWDASAIARVDVIDAAQPVS
jgi:hypothetical protein